MAVYYIVMLSVHFSLLSGVDEVVLLELGPLGELLVAVFATERESAALLAREMEAPCFPNFFFFFFKLKACRRISRTAICFEIFAICQLCHRNFG